MPRIIVIVNAALKTNTLAATTRGALQKNQTAGVVAHRFTCGIPAELQHLIRRMAREDPSSGEERIANGLLLRLGHGFAAHCSQAYAERPRPDPPSRVHNSVGRDERL
jgi:hypothetical protein